MAERLLTLPDRLKDWRFTIDAEHIAWAVFDRQDEKMNTLGRRPTEELGRILDMADEAARVGDAIGLVFISAKRDNFIAGGDEFMRLAVGSTLFK